MQAQAFTRSEIEDFLYHEAALLDDWQLPEWLALYTADARYEVPICPRTHLRKTTCFTSPTTPSA